MTKLNSIGYKKIMKRLSILLSIAILMFAASGIHSITLNQPMEERAFQLFTTVDAGEQIEIADSGDCCAGVDVKIHSPHDHCNMTCAILQNADYAESGWKTKVFSAIRADHMVDNPLDRMERPPRSII